METVPLKEYVDTKFRGIEEATHVAYQSMERRLDGMNEFRDTLRDQASRFITRAELEAKEQRIDSELKILNTSKDVLQGKASQNSVLFGYGLAFLGILISVYSLLK